MTTVEKTERVIEKLPPEDFGRLSAWMVHRWEPPAPEPPAQPAVPLYNHSAFLGSCAPEDEGLYDHAAEL